MTRLALVMLTAFISGCVVRTAQRPPPPPPPQPAPAPDPAPPPPVVVTPAPAPPPPVWNSTGWVLLGETEVDGRRDRDVVQVGRDEGRFRQLMLVVDGSDLELFDLEVKFGRGKPWDVPVRHFFREGTRTRAIDLPGDNRIIKRVELRYGNLPGGGRARVQVWGR